MIIHPVINLYDHQTVKMFESKFGGKTARQFLYRKKLWCKIKMRNCIGGQ